VQEREREGEKGIVEGSERETEREKESESKS